MFGYPKWRAWTVIVVSLLGIFFSIPNFMSPEYYKAHVPAKMQSWWHPMTLGLDLQGGIGLVLEIQADEMVNEHLLSLAESTHATLRDKKIKHSTPKVDNGKMSVKILDSKNLTTAENLITKLETAELIVEREDNELIISYSDMALEKMKAEAAAQSIDIVRNRIDALGTTEPAIQREGADRISVQLPNKKKNATAEEKKKEKSEVVDLLKSTAKMSFHLVDSSMSVKDAERDLARGKILDSMVVEGDETGPLLLKRAVIVGGDQLDDARSTYDDSGHPAISFSFKTAGAKKFAEVTRTNIGERLAIVLDGKVISAPSIQTQITGGKGIITGNFTVQEASRLAMQLRSGALPAPLKVVQTEEYGAELGEDSIRKGAYSCIVGALLVFAFMFLVYGWFGIFANVALIVNVCLIFATLSALGATLTLPGLAGIALTIGMAVDANVLIYSRMRDEIKSGHTVPLNVIDSGFSNAFTAIVDSQITTLFAAVVLFFMGSGPIKGFSVTLGIGIFTSLFTAIMITKFLIMIWYSLKKPKEIKIKL